MIEAQFVIPVIREPDPAVLESICLALADGGLHIQEITLMSESAYDVIRKLRGRLTVGAGTVLTRDQALRAVDAGAKFLVSPGLNVEAVKAVSVPFYPGCLTPTEIMQAAAAGCSTIKIFPASNMGGPSYLSSLKGPFPQLKWFPSGGISLANLREYRDAGAIAVGMGGKLLPSEAIKARKWDQLTKAAVDHVAAAKAVMSQAGR